MNSHTFNVILWQIDMIVIIFKSREESIQLGLVLEFRHEHFVIVDDCDEISENQREYGISHYEVQNAKDSLAVGNWVEVSKAHSRKCREHVVRGQDGVMNR